MGTPKGSHPQKLSLLSLLLAFKLNRDHFGPKMGPAIGHIRRKRPLPLNRVSLIFLPLKPGVIALCERPSLSRLPSILVEIRSRLI